MRKVQVYIGIDDDAVVVLINVLAIELTSEFDDLVQITSLDSKRLIEFVTNYDSDPVLIKNIGIDIFAKTY